VVGRRFTEDGRDTESAGLPCAGITQIRFDGCDLSRPFRQHPVAQRTLTVRAEVGKRHCACNPCGAAEKLLVKKHGINLPCFAADLTLIV
jgi:hypothetical protein